MKDPQHTIKVLRTKEVYRGSYIVVEEEECELPTGKVVIRGRVKHPGAVVIVPVTPEGKVMMISQFRVPIRQAIIEFPAGTLEKGEPPLSCAKREIVEEIGFEAKSWEELGVLYPAPGFCDEVQHLYVAKDLVQCKASPEEDELIEVHTYTVREVGAMIDMGVITDAKTIAAFARARIRGVV